MNKVCTEMSSLHLEGNIICPSWHNYIKCGKLQKPDLVATMILADVLTQYTIQNELQKNYQQYYDFLGVTKERIKESIDNLISLNLIVREFKTIKTEMGINITNVMFLEPNLETIEGITNDDI